GIIRLRDGSQDENPEQCQTGYSNAGNHGCSFAKGNRAKWIALRLRVLHSTRPNMRTVASVAMNEEPIATAPKMIRATPMTIRNMRPARRLSRSLALIVWTPSLDAASFMDCSPFSE